jgi:hypothetical protein
MKKLLAIALIGLALYSFKDWPSVPDTKTPMPLRILPAILKIILFSNQSSDASSLVSDNASGSAASSPHPEAAFYSQQAMDLQYRVVDLELERDELQAEIDRLRREMAPKVVMKPVPAYRAAPAVCTGPGCNQATGNYYGNSQNTRRGLFGWRR